MFKFMLCALDVGTHALHVVMQRILLRLRETVDQKTLHTLPVRFEIGDDGVGFIRQHNALTSCVVRHGFTGNQPFLLHQRQHAGCRGTGDAEFLLDGVLIDLPIPIARQEHDDMRVAAGGLLGGERHAFAQITVDGLTHRPYFNAENTLLHTPPYHVCRCENRIPIIQAT